MATVQGIDTGSWRTRVVTMEGSFRRFEIAGAAEAVTELDEAGAARVDLAFATLLPAGGAPVEVERVAAFPLDLGTVKLVRLPFSDKNAIAKALPAAVEASVPWDLEEMVLATHILEAGEGGSRVIAYVAPRTEVAARIDALRQAGVEPRNVVFDADVLAAYNDGGVQAIVDVGHRRTVVALAQGGVLQGARLVPSGGADLTLAIAQAAGCSVDEAESAKHAARLPEAPTPVEAGWDDLALDDEVTATGAVPLWQAVLEQGVDVWIRELRAELIALEDETGLGIDEVLLCGGGSRLAGLGERISASLGVGVRGVVVPGGHGPELALAVSLARVAAGERRATDLRVGDLAYHGHADLLWRVTAASLLGGAAFLVAAVALFTMQYVEATRALATADQAIVDAVVNAVPGTAPERVAGQPNMAMAILQETQAATQARVDALGNTLGGVPPTLDLLRRLSQGMPAPGDARIDVREMNLDAESLALKAETDSYEMAAKIEESLKRDGYFPTAKKSDEKKSGEIVTFAVNIPLGEPDGAVAPAEGEGG